MGLLIKDTVKTTKPTLVYLQRMVWTLIYGGLLTMVLAYFMEHSQHEDATLLYAIGIVLTVAGLVLVYVRSRMQE